MLGDFIVENCLVENIVVETIIIESTALISAVSYTASRGREDQCRNEYGGQNQVLPETGEMRGSDSLHTA